MSKWRKCTHYTAAISSNFIKTYECKHIARFRKYRSKQNEALSRDNEMRDDAGKAK